MAQQLRFFSDKETFTFDHVCNCQNDQGLAEVKGVCKTKYPQQVRVLGVFGSDGQKMHLYFFPQGDEVVAKAYYIIL